MRSIVGGVFQSLDGVMQAPGGPDEDPTGGFGSGGWSARFWDGAMGTAMGGLFNAPFDLLLGRRTYEIFAAHWPYATGEDAAMGAMFTQATKYVLTRGGTALDWANSVALADIDAVARVRAGDGPNLLIQGSTTLYPALLAAGLIDRLFVMTFPVVLGRGKRLFDAGTPPFALTLVDHSVSSTGVVMATYAPAGAVQTGSFAQAVPSAREIARRARMAAEG